ncbi:MAG: patatin-like phospholipase family protein [Archangium sp.]|nr:patatin-like phospholipase family protein [Archangium sp.]
MSLTSVLAAAEAPVEPVGIAISGGVSLGTWEAGFMYLTLEAHKASRRSQLRVVTGASAGSANAFISAVSSCLPANPDPMQDPGWKVWGPIGFDQLFDPHRANDEALFVGKPFEESIERVRLVWNAGLPERCDVVVGVSVTRVTPRQLRIGDGLTVPRALETFVVRIQGRGMGKAPRLTNYVDPLGLMPTPLLPFLDDESPEATEKNFTQLSSLVLASGAFPLAFKPRPIEYCLSKPGRDGKPGDTRCVVPDFKDLFVDGGVFDNNPLRLAWTLADRRLVRSSEGRFFWADPRTPADATLQPAVRYLYLDPDTEVFPPEPPIVDPTPEAGFLSRVLSMSGDMVESAQARELGQLVNERADLTGRLHLPMNNLPKASEHLWAFIGFFEQDFRRFDFYLGMYDALVELKEGPGWKEEPIDFEAMRGSDAAARKNWAPFLCLLSMAEPGFERYRAECEGAELENFRILLQVSLDRLHERCRPTRESKREATRPHFRCEQANAGKEAAQVPGVKPLPAEERQRLEEEPEFELFMRLLGAYEFEFKDLGLSRARARGGKLAMRERLDEVVDEWAGAQGSFTTRFLAKTAARLSLHTIEFSPPLFSGYVSLGTTIEGGASIVPFFWRPHWLQVTAALGVGALETLATEVRPRVSFTLSAGPELHLSPVSSSLLQPRFSVRGGVQLNVFDTFGTAPCVGGDARSCTQPVLELVGVVSLFERVRVHATWQTFPVLYGRTRGFFYLQFGVGFQFL